MADATTTTAPMPCRGEESNCSSADVIATVTRLYETAGATHAEAACLAPITGKDAHAVNEAFDAPTAAQTREAIACVGTEARLRTIATALGDIFGAQAKGLGSCLIWQRAATAAAAVHHDLTSRYPTTFTEITRGSRPTLELTADVTVDESGTRILGSGWTLTMSGDGSEEPQLECSTG